MSVIVYECYITESTGIPERDYRVSDHRLHAEKRTIRTENRVRIPENMFMKKNHDKNALKDCDSLSKSHSLYEPHELPPRLWYLDIPHSRLHLSLSPLSLSPFSLSLPPASPHPLPVSL